MLEKLTINNYALIDLTTVDFHKGFTVITGETGAGKSIMLDAVGLLMGSRADTKAMGDTDKKTIVEAVFSSPEKKCKDIFDEYGIEWDDREIILRREISPSGKSRGFVNDTPVNNGILANLSEHLIDIHSQHSNSLLSRAQEQIAIVDAYGHTASLLDSYKLSFKNYIELRNRIKTIKENISKGKENEEFIRFRLEQLDKLKPKKGELAILEREAEILGDADRIKSNLTEAIVLLSHGPSSALRQVQSATSSLEDIDMSLLEEGEDIELTERLNTLKIELRDIADTLEAYSEQINSDPLRLEKVQGRIDNIYDIMKRFKVKNDEELVTLHERLKEELSSITGDNTDIRKLETELKERAKELKEKADELTLNRIKASESFAKELEETLVPLGLPNIKFNITVEKGKMTSEGQDVITFYCSFNKNHPMQPVSEIASGGEISRVMLGIKSIMTKKMQLPTIIFDEIDTGVSGEIAHRMGKMMKQMSESHQVMSVTHLPQVAAHGDIHLKVYKTDDADKTISHIKVLDPEEREREIAGMLSGNTINEVALENARMLLKSE